MTAAAHASLASAQDIVTRATRLERHGRNHSLERRAAACGPRAEPVSDDDATLVHSLLRRDEAAWRTFRRRFDPVTMRAIASASRRGRGRADRCEVEEIHASLLCSLLEHDMRKLRRFDAARGSLEAFLHVLARHAAISHARSHSRRRLATSLDEQVQVLTAPERDPSCLLDEARRRSQLTVVLQTLSERDRVFLELLYVEEQTAEQIAQTLRVTIETVYTKKVRIQQRLRRAQARKRG